MKRIHKGHKVTFLTDSPHMPQTKAKKAKSRIFMKVGWFDPPMGGSDQPQYFCPGGHPNGRGSPPNFQFTSKNYLQYVFTDFKILYTI